MDPNHPEKARQDTPRDDRSKDHVQLNRRAFLRTAGGITVGAALLGEARQAEGSSAVHADPDAMGVLVDLTKCNGCRQCEAACSSIAGFDTPTKEELLDESVFEQRRRPGPRNYTRVNRTIVESSPEGPHPVYAKLNCMHCVDPACMSACLVGAMRKEPNGAVSYDASKCMGCRYCMVACPFQMPAYEYENVLTPQVRKCTFCSNEGNPYKGQTPACVQACPRQCLIHGKRSELLDQARNRIARYPGEYVDHIYGEHEAGGTSWLYISGVSFEELAFPQVGSDAPPRRAEAIQHGIFSHFMPPVAWYGVLALIAWISKGTAVAAPLVSAQSCAANPGHTQARSGNNRPPRHDPTVRLDMPEEPRS